MYFIYIPLTYVLTHGLTDQIVAPIQALAFPEKTVFASLIYLPHGVRVLAVWAFGWKAVAPIFIGTFLSICLFSTSEEIAFLSPQLWEGVFMGSISALLAFELARLTGYNLYAGEEKKLSWKGLISVGAMASVFNSIGQTAIYSELIGFEDLGKTLVFYAVGDLAGLILCMVALMYAFRWLRFFNH